MEWKTFQANLHQSLTISDKVRRTQDKSAACSIIWASTQQRLYPCERTAREALHDSTKMHSMIGHQATCLYCSEVSYPNKPTWISPTPRLRCLPRRISPVRRPSSSFVGDQCSCQVHHTSATSRLGNEWRIQDHPFVKHKNDSSRNQAGWDFVNDIVLQSCAFDPDLKWTYGIPCSTIFFSQWQTHQGGRLLPSLPGQTGLGNKSRPSKLSNISSCEVVFNIGPSAWKLPHNDVLAQFLTCPATGTSAQTLANSILQSECIIAIRGK